MSQVQMKIIFIILVMTLSSLPNICMFLDEESNDFCIPIIFLMIWFISLRALPACLSVDHMWGWHTEVGSVSSTLEPELQMAASHHVGAVHCIHSLCKSSGVLHH